MRWAYFIQPICLQMLPCKWLQADTHTAVYLYCDCFVQGELLVSPKKVLFLDEISTGLDSSTTFQISRTLRDFCHLREATMLVALLQPTPETYNLFDDVLLLSEGNHGDLCDCTAVLQM